MKPLNLPQEIITSIDVLNTLNGGTTEPVIKLRKLASRHEIIVRVPGLPLTQIKIEIKNNQLVIYYLMPVITEGKGIQFTKYLYTAAIPYFVDAKSITATENGDAMVVNMPFNDFSKGYYRDLSIQH
jgi:HSP20 family molecular chaperone IbpA